MEGNGDLYCLSNKVLDLAEHWEVVLGLDVLWISSIQASNKGTERGDADTLADSKYS